MSVYVLKNDSGFYTLNIDIEPHITQSVVISFDDIKVDGSIVQLTFEGAHKAHVYYDVAKAVIEFMENEK